MVQWLRLRTSNAGGAGSIPGQGTKVPHATQPKKKNKAAAEKGILEAMANLDLRMAFSPTVMSENKF